MMTRISRKLVIIVLTILITISIGGIPIVAAAANISSQDGIGYSGSIHGNEVVGTVFTGYQAWPSGFTKGSSAFVGGVYDGTSIWMIPYNADRLIKVDPSTGEMTEYSNWPDGFTKGSNAFAGGVYDGTHIWLIPYSADQVIKVDASTGEMTGYSSWPGGTRGIEQFMGGTYDGSHIWLTPYSGSRLIRVDATTGAMTSYNSWPSGTVLGSYPFYGSIFDGTSIWLIPYGANRLIKVDPSNGDMTGFNNWPSGFTKSADAFSGGVFDGTHIWLIPNNATHVVKINTATGDMTGYNGWPFGFTKGSGSFAGGVYDGTNIWLVPLSASMLIKVNAATGVMTGFDNWPSDFTKGSNAFMGGVYDGDNVWMIPFMADRLMKFGDSADLSGLTLSNGTLSPAFSSAITSYTASVGSEVTSVDVTPTAVEIDATISVNGSTVTSGQAIETALEFGDNTIAVEVYTNNGNLNKNYSLTVTRTTYGSADLSGLTLSSGTLSPAFSATKTSYTASVGSGVTSVDITPTAVNADATITVNGSGVTSGQAKAMALNVGNNTITVDVTAEDGITNKSYALTVTRATYASTDNSDNSSGGGMPGIINTDTSNIIFINGKAVDVGTMTISQRNEQTVTTFTIDPGKLVELLRLGGGGSVVSITSNGSDVLIGELNGLVIKMLIDYDIDLEIKSDRGSYIIPVQHMNIDAIMRQFGASVELKDIRIQVEIASSTPEKVKFVEAAAANANLTLLVPPLEFIVRVIYGDQQVEVSKFGAFIERSIVLPDNIDPSRITTGVVIDANGTIRHVPTKVIQHEGGNLTVLNSLTNSTYSVISNNVEFSDVTQHWGKQAINDMGSRLVVQGTGESFFNPDKPITRAEVAAIVVRALGLKPEDGATDFVDVKASDWYSEAVRTAKQYQLITGFEDGSFRPKEMITREQAMTIISKAMKLTGLKDRLPIQDAVVTLRPFADGGQVAEWAKSDVAAGILAGIITGRSDATLAAKASVTRAEVTIMIQLLLKKSDLI
jgi:hypothetical protein